MASGDNINIITLARGEIMLRMVKLRGAQLNHFAAQSGEWGLYLTFNIINPKFKIQPPRIYILDSVGLDTYNTRP